MRSEYIVNNVQRTRAREKSRSILHKILAIVVNKPPEDRDKMYFNTHTVNCRSRNE